jgi:phosphomannomutase
LVKGFDGKAYRIGWDSGNGAAGPVLEKLIQRLPGEHHAIFTEVDGRFPNHHPDSHRRSQSRRFEEAGSRQTARLRFAFDGDADRIGAVDSRGRVIWGDQLLIILAGPVLKELPGSTIIADVKASQTLFRSN